MANKLSKLTMADANKPSGDYPIATGPSRSTKEQDMERRRWRAKDAMRTLIEAERIRKDRQLMADIQVVAAEEAKKLRTIQERRPGAK
jgi:hypothetical protein